MRIAMWSGPRNLSTAMMYSFAARSDCAVIDEPFYAAYLKKTGLDHPMTAEILASQSTDPNEISPQLTESIPAGKMHFYQKHMTQHMISSVPRDWMKEMVNVFLIRHPARVIASYAAKREQPSLDDIGFRQQAELFDLVQSWGQSPIVIDSHDVRENPRLALQKLCDAIGLPFEAQMLNWPKGPHPDDGVWASHWYGAVWASTSFADPEGPLPLLDGDLAAVVEQALPYYEQMKVKKL